jgi:hypothetical protein
MYDILNCCSCGVPEGLAMCFASFQPVIMSTHTGIIVDNTGRHFETKIYTFLKVLYAVIIPSESFSKEDAQATCITEPDILPETTFHVESLSQQDKH